MTERSPLRLNVGPGLVFEIESPSLGLRRAIEEQLAFFVERRTSTCGRPLAIRASRPPRSRPEGAPAVSEGSLEVYRDEHAVFLEAPGILSWYDLDSGDAGIWVTTENEPSLAAFASLALVSLLIELAAPRGWLALHAAAVASADHGILLPGESGVGKSTLFESCRQSGFGVLSDDLVWLHLTQGAPRLHPFPRGDGHSVISPTCDQVPLRSIVCPSIVPGSASTIARARPSQVAQVLLAQSSFLTSGQAKARRFKELARIAAITPGFALQAGTDPESPPKLLRELALESFGSRPC